jgi:hypothetical protein
VNLPVSLDPGPVQRKISRCLLRGCQQSSRSEQTDEPIAGVDQESRQSPSREAILPSAMHFPLSPSIWMLPRAAIQGLAKRSGDNQTAPMSHIMIAAESRIAQWFILCTWWKAPASFMRTSLGTFEMGRSG